MADKLSPADLCELVSYDPDTGLFDWAPKRSWFASQAHWNAFLALTAGKRPLSTLHSEGYLVGALGSESCVLAHRAAVAARTGRWPEHEVDHINRKRDDNRWDNLRLASRVENCRNQPLRVNNTSGVVGVSWSQERRKWCASITIEGRTVPLGRYDTFEDAVSARKAAEIKYDFHPNHGRPV